MLTPVVLTVPVRQETQFHILQMGKLRSRETNFSIVTMHLSVPRFSSVHASCPRLIVKSAPFHSQSLQIWTTNFTHLPTSSKRLDLAQTQAPRGGAPTVILGHQAALSTLSFNTLQFAVQLTLRSGSNMLFTGEVIFVTIWSSSVWFTVQVNFSVLCWECGYGTREHILNCGALFSGFF